MSSMHLHKIQPYCHTPKIWVIFLNSDSKTWSYIFMEAEILKNECLLTNCSWSMRISNHFQLGWFQRKNIKGIVTTLVSLSSSSLLSQSSLWQNSNLGYNLGCVEANLMNFIHLFTITRAIIWLRSINLQAFFTKLCPFMDLGNNRRALASACGALVPIISILKSIHFNLRIFKISFFAIWIWDSNWIQHYRLQGCCTFCKETIQPYLPIIMPWPIILIIFCLFNV